MGYSNGNGRGRGGKSGSGSGDAWLLLSHLLHEMLLHWINLDVRIEILNGWAGAGELAAAGEQWR